jgi:hypothetical protein
MILDDIIELRRASGIDFGETYADLLRCYKAYERYGYLEYIWEDGELKGFVDWLRLPRLPKKREFTWKDIPLIGRGDYIYIGTICVKDKKYFWRLLDMVRKKEKNKARFICWYDIKGILHVHKNMKGV